MKTELEKKLNKLPARIKTYSNDYHCVYQLKITKMIENDNWIIEYIDSNDNSIIKVEHRSLQAAVDNTLAVINKDDF
jgi:hypothetical protein